MFSLHKISVSVILIFSCYTASGTDPYRLSAGASEAGTGYSCIANPGFWSSFHNQALLAGLKSLSFSLGYDNRFGIREMSTCYAGLTMPAGKTVMGAVYSHFGYSDFNRQMTGLACGLKLSENISAGIMIDYFSSKTAGKYCNRESVTCEAGLVFSNNENITAAIHIFNPVPNSIRKTYLPSRLRAGAGITLNNSVNAGIEAEMSTGEKLNIKTGFEYNSGKKFWMRAGFCTDNASFSFGIGYLMKYAKLDLAFLTHEKLGITSSTSLIFTIR